MGLFSDVVADSRPRALPGTPMSSAMPAMPSDQERSTMFSEGEERTGDSASEPREIPTDPGRAQDPAPRQGVDSSLPKVSVAAVSRTVEGVVRDLKGKRSTERGTTDGQNEDTGSSEAVLRNRNRKERTANGLHVDLDAHESAPSFSGQTAVSSGPSFDRGSGDSETTDSKLFSLDQSTGTHGEPDKGTAVPEGRQSPGKIPPPPEPKAVVPSALRLPTEATPLKESAEGRRERVFEVSLEAPADRAGHATRPSPPAPLPTSLPDPRERGEVRRPASAPSESAASQDKSGDGRVPTPIVATPPSPGGPGVRPGEGPGVRALPVPESVPAARREASREPSGPRVQIGRLEVIVLAPTPPAPPVAPVAPPSSSSPKPGALASRRYLRSL